MDVARLGSQGHRLARVRVAAAVDARHDVGALAVDVDVAVEVAVGAELLDEVDLDREALAVRGADLDVLGADADRDLAAVGAADGVAVELAEICRRSSVDLDKLEPRMGETSLLRRPSC